MYYTMQRINVATAIVAAVVATALLFMSLMVFEPVVAFGQTNSNSFEITSEITGEVSFLTQPTDVDLTGGSAINGISGGLAVGTTTFNVTTNDTNGYTVTIAFDSAVAMQGDSGVSTDIPNYAPTVGGTPDYNFSVSTGEAWFAYTAYNNTTPADTDASFKDNGSTTCGSGTASVGHCWFNKTTATDPEQIIDGAQTAISGATSTLVFQVGVGSDPDPALDSGTYTATATLTANVKP